MNTRSSIRSARRPHRNGLALCKRHHAAFDRYLIGVTPDLEVTVRLDVLAEIDGPTLQHGLQGFRAGASTCRAPTTSSPIATSSPSATPSSAAPADRQRMDTPSTLSGARNPRGTRGTASTLLLGARRFPSAFLPSGLAQ
jgi:hypothetical protein